MIPDPVDVYVGNKVRERRLLMGLSQESLAKLIGLTFQQIQKYERGTNRISVSRLVDICNALKVPVEYFLEETLASAAANSSKLIKKAAKGFAENNQESISYDSNIMTRKDVIELVRAYSKIQNPKLKKQIIEMVKTMSIDESK